MKRITYRQHLGILEWLDQQWNTLDKKDHYLIQIATEVRRTHSRKGVKLEDLKIPFVHKGEDPDRALTEEERAEKIKRISTLSRARWTAALTASAKKYQANKHLADQQRKEVADGRSK